MIHIVFVDLVYEDDDIALFAGKGRVALMAAADPQVVNVDLYVFQWA